MKPNRPFTIHYKDGFAYLAVFPGFEGGTPLYPEEIEGKLKLLGIPKVRRNIIHSIIEEQSGEPVQIAPWPEGEVLSPSVEVEISPDNMSATIMISPGKQGGEHLSPEMITKKLEKEGIVFGIREDEIKDAAEKEIYNTKITAAAGIYPIHSKSASAEYFFETDRGKPFRELEFGRIDLKELNFIQNVDKGKILARMRDPVPPAEGMDIFGNTLYPENNNTPFKLTPGKGTCFSEDKEEIIAGISGNVKLKGTTLTVEPIVQVENIDYSNGNMDFDGTINVRGRIADGFTVKASGDIQIGKSVSRIMINSGGDVILKAGISGNDEGTIFCGGDMYARYIENAIVICRGNIYVEEAIMHSNIKAHGNIILTGKRAEVFGGVISAGGNIVCKKLGSINEPVTEIHLGMGVDDYTAFLSLKQAVDSLITDIDATDVKINQFKRAALKSEKGSEVLVKIKNAEKQLETDLKKLQEEYKAKLKELHSVENNLKITEQAKLIVKERIFGKVFIYFGSRKWKQSGKGTLKTTLVYKDGMIIDQE